MLISLLSIATIKEFTNITTDVLFNHEFTTRVIELVLRNVKNKVIKHDKCFTLSDSCIKFESTHDNVRVFEIG